MREIAPILALRPLRRLLDMHDVSYSQKDKVKELRTKLRKFMTRLQRGKHGDDDVRLT
jgi:hypothetical protein